MEKRDKESGASKNLNFPVLTYYNYQFNLGLAFRLEDINNKGKQ
jgi:hypothetical protein